MKSDPAVTASTTLAEAKAMIDAERYELDHEQVLRLISSMQFDGWLPELAGVHTQDGFVIDGRHRIAAAEALSSNGLTVEPVLRVVEVHDAETLLRLAAAANIHKWDPDRSARLSELEGAIAVATDDPGNAYRPGLEVGSAAVTVGEMNPTALLQRLIEAGAVVSDDEVVLGHFERRGVSVQVPARRIDGGPTKYGYHALGARPVELFAVDREGRRSLWVGSTLNANEITWADEVEACHGCGEQVLWQTRRARVTPGPHPCSERCRSKIRRGESDRTRECANCGASFTPSRSDAKTCSPRCRVALHRRNGS